MSEDITQAKAELFDHVDKRVNEQIDRAREFLKLTIGTAMKILAGVVVTLLFFLTVFGVKTAYDISQAIEQMIQAAIDKRLDKQDPLAAYRSEAETLYDRALVDSLRIATIRADNSSDHWDNPELTPVQQQRLIKIISNPKTSLELFNEAAIILRQASHQELWPAAAARIYQLISDAEESEWINQQSQKLAKLIDVLAARPYAQGTYSIRSLIRNDAVEESVQVAAIRHAAAVRDFAAIDDIEILSRSNSPELERAARHALAHLKPTSQAVSQWVNDYTNTQNATLQHHAEALQLFIQLNYANRRARFRSDHDLDIPVRTQTAKMLLSTAVLSGVRFISYRTGWRGREFGFEIAFADQLGVPVRDRISRAALFGPGVRIVYDLLREWASDMSKFKSLLDAVSIQQQTGGHRLSVLQVKLDGDSKLVLESGKEISSMQAEQGVTLVPGNYNGNVAIQANWRDPVGLLQSGRVVDIRDGASLSFTIKSDVTFVAEE